MKLLTQKSFTTMLMVLSLALVGCASDSKKSSEGSSDSLVNDNTDARSIELSGSSDESTAGPLRTIYFDYNSSSLTSVGRSTLEQNAEFLKLTDAVAVQIEGHCDERGGIQYNICPEVHTTDTIDSVQHRSWRKKSTSC